MIIGAHDTAKRAFVIAEIGNNHEGDLDLAKRLIGQAAESGADAVKFQTIVPERLVSVQDEKRIAQLRKFQFIREQFEELHDKAKQCGVEFLSTPFDVNSVDWLDKLVPAWKIASCDNDFFPLLDRVAATGKPVLVSMGLGHHDQAQQLLEFFEDAWSRHNTRATLGMLHCVVSYPTPDNEAGLRKISHINLPGVTPGYSDHTIGTKAAELAVAAGARIVEKHFTINKKHSEFRDHQLSADPSDMRQMVGAIRNAERMLSSSMAGAQVCEEPNRDAVRRSLAAVKDLPVGAEVTMDDFVWVRPGTGIRPGEESLVLGKKLAKPLTAGETMSTDHLA